MYNLKLYEKLKKVAVDQIKSQLSELKAIAKQDNGTEDYFVALCKAAKSCVSFEEWQSFIKGANFGAPVRLNASELEALRAGAAAAGSKFGWNQIYSSAAVTAKPAAVVAPAKTLAPATLAPAAATLKK